MDEFVRFFVGLDEEQRSRLIRRLRSPVFVDHLERIDILMRSSHDEVLDAPVGEKRNTELRRTSTDSTKVQSNRVKKDSAVAGQFESLFLDRNLFPNAESVAAFAGELLGESFDRDVQNRVSRKALARKLKNKIEKLGPAKLARVKQIARALLEPRNSSEHYMDLFEALVRSG